MKELEMIYKNILVISIFDTKTLDEYIQSNVNPVVNHSLEIGFLKDQSFKTAQQMRKIDGSLDLLKS